MLLRVNTVGVDLVAEGPFMMEPIGKVVKYPDMPLKKAVNMVRSRWRKSPRVSRVDMLYWAHKNTGWALTTDILDSIKKSIQEINI